MEQSDTLQLMRVIGLPSNRSSNRKNLSEDFLLGLFPLAIKNRVALLFLERALTMCNHSKSLKVLHQNYTKKSQLELNLITEIHRKLAQTKTNYVLFKTIKPFPFTTVDVDILFFTRRDFIQAYRTLRIQGFKLAGYGAYSITLYSPKHDMNIDLQLEISVSRMVYMNKLLFQRYITEIDVDGSQVSVLEPQAELVMVITHSFYKEQMFTLSDYYSTIIKMSKMDKHHRKTFVHLAEKLNVGQGLKLTLKLTNALTVMAFKRNVPYITETAQSIQTNGIEEKSIQIALSHLVKNSNLPYKYHPISIALAFLVKALTDSVMRGSMGQQLVEMVTNTSNFMESTWLHIKRDTY